ncbi:Linoleate diol synthase, partial [Frankliniella fusca]
MLHKINGEQQVNKHLAPKDQCKNIKLPSRIKIYSSSPSRNYMFLHQIMEAGSSALYAPTPLRSLLDLVVGGNLAVDGGGVGSVGDGGGVGSVGDGGGDALDNGGRVGQGGGVGDGGGGVGDGSGGNHSLGDEGLLTDNSVEAVDGVSGVVDGAAGAVGVGQGVGALDNITLARLVLVLGVAGQSVLHV